MTKAIKTPQGWKDSKASWFKTSEGWILVDGTPGFDKPIEGISAEITKIEISWIVLSQEVEGAVWYCTYTDKCDSPNCQMVMRLMDSEGAEVYAQQHGYACAGNPYVYEGISITPATLGTTWQQNISSVNVSGFSEQAFTAYNRDNVMVCRGIMRSAPKGSPNAFMIEEYGDVDPEAKLQYWLYEWDCGMTKREGFYTADDGDIP